MSTLNLNEIEALEIHSSIVEHCPPTMASYLLHIHYFSFLYPFRYKEQFVYKAP